MSAPSGIDGQTGNPPPPILTLPVEILSMIFRECDDDGQDLPDLPNIRGTCKIFDSIVAPMLAAEWSGCLRIYLSRPSVKGLGTMSSTFASQVKTIRLYTLRYNSVPKPDLFARGREHNKRRQDICTEERWSASTCNSPRKKLLEDIDNHNERVARQNQYIVAGGPLADLLQALHSLKACNNADVSFEVFDNPDQYRFGVVERMTIFGIDASHQTHDTSSIVKVLAHAINLSQYPVKAITLETSYGTRPTNNIQLEDMFWNKLPSVPEVSIKMQNRTSEADLDEPSNPDFNVISISSEGNHLTMVDQSFRLDYNGNPDPLFSRSNYGAFYDFIRGKQFRKVTLNNIDAHHDFIGSALNFHSENLESLEICSVLLTKSFDENGWLGTALIFLGHLKSMSTLQSLTLSDIVDGDHGDIQEDEVIWNGQEEIQMGLDVLIRKVKIWYI
ncbi:hypothetical protein D6D22_01852 [Aureobasidium pullulans]|uniref:F-box domain-containing protein n=1 Tax=Aureobasidium pullulans TaxID=5580 RepID=A0A4S8Y5P0_AURPU|nr:hypothetical protein D6D22_01852 [Aureobasidium pullulans]